MAQLSEHHKVLTNGEGKCSVPMWSGGVPAGFCDKPAYGPKRDDLNPWDYQPFVPGLACHWHGGPFAKAPMQEAFPAVERQAAAEARIVVTAARLAEIEQEAWRSNDETTAALCSEIRESWNALRDYLKAQTRMADKWAEGDDAVKRQLWQNLHACEDAARAVLGDGG